MSGTSPSRSCWLRAPGGRRRRPLRVSSQRGHSSGLFSSPRELPPSLSPAHGTSQRPHHKRQRVGRGLQHLDLGRRSTPQQSQDPRTEHRHLHLGGAHRMSSAPRRLAALGTRARWSAVGFPKLDANALGTGNPCSRLGWLGTGGLGGHGGDTQGLLWASASPPPAPSSPPPSRQRPLLERTGTAPPPLSSLPGHLRQTDPSRHSLAFSLMPTNPHGRGLPRDTFYTREN